MAFPTHHSSPTTSGFPNTAIRQLNGTLFILAIVEDEDDAACLRTDLNRSNLVNYKLQHCCSVDEGLSLVGACEFDLILLSVSQRKDLGIAAQQIRNTSFTQPIIALASHRVLKDYAGNKPKGIDEILKLEDMNPSLVEQAVRCATEHYQMVEMRDSMRERLEIALDAGKLGLWTYTSQQFSIELDPISATMFGFPEKPCLVSLDDALSNVYPEDQAQVRETFDQLGIAPQSFHCEFRLNEDKVPLTRIALQGRFKENPDADGCLVIGVAKEVEQSSELFSRIVDANSDIQDALSTREDALQAANQKLRSIADEFGMPMSKRSNSTSYEILEEDTTVIAEVKPQAEEPSQPAIESEKQAAARSKIKIHTIPAGQKGPVVRTPAPTPERKTEDNSEGNLVDNTAAASTETAPSEIQPELIPTEELQTQSSALSVDKKATYKKVLNSIPPAESLDPHNHQQSFPFDFFRDPITDFSEPNPSEEGFIPAAQRIVAITRRGHELDVSISISDQQLLEEESESELLFAVLKELLTNVVLHAQASLCIISIFKDEDEWVLQVEDDGIGLEEKLKSVSSPLNQIGLFRIRTQLALKGGHLDMAPASPTGLVARARLPVNIASNATVSSRP